MKIHVTDRDGAEHVVEGQEGDALMIPLQGADLVDATCSGSCSCATCHVFVDEAFLSKLPEPESAEEEMLDFLVERKPESRLLPVIYRLSFIAHHHPMAGSTLCHFLRPRLL